jgi:hypothetical protein
MYDMNLVDCGNSDVYNRQVVIIIKRKNDSQKPNTPHRCTRLEITQPNRAKLSFEVAATPAYPVRHSVSSVLEDNG